MIIQKTALGKFTDMETGKEYDFNGLWPDIPLEVAKGIIKDRIKREQRRAGRPGKKPQPPILESLTYMRDMARDMKELDIMEGLKK